MTGVAPEDERQAPGPLVNAPGVVLVLILAFVVVHAIQMLGGEANQVWMIFNFGLHPLHVTDTGGWATAWLWFPAWIKLVTHAFLHADLAHLVFNSVWFLVFGSIVARRTGTWRFLALFLVTAVAGGLVHVLVYPQSMIPVSVPRVRSVVCLGPRSASSCEAGIPRPMRLCFRCSAGLC